MAERRMFSLKITGSDAFLSLPLTAQALYFHIGMNADDDGFVGNALAVTRMAGADKNDLDTLVGQGFLARFKSGVVAVVHWQLQNRIRPEIYRETIYKTEKALFLSGENAKIPEGQSLSADETSSQASEQISEQISENVSTLSSDEASLHASVSSPQEASESVSDPAISDVVGEWGFLSFSGGNFDGLPKERKDKSNIVKYNTHIACASHAERSTALQEEHSKSAVSDIRLSECGCDMHNNGQSSHVKQGEGYKNNLNFVETGRNVGFGRHDFIPPDVETVAAYCRERNNGIDADEFVDFYASKGWMIGQWRMADWRAAVRSWEHNRKKRSEALSAGSERSSSAWVSEPTFDVDEFFAAAIAHSYRAPRGR